MNKTLVTKVEVFDHLINVGTLSPSNVSLEIEIEDRKCYSSHHFSFFIS